MASCLIPIYINFLFFYLWVYCLYTRQSFQYSDSNNLNLTLQISKFKTCYVMCLCWSEYKIIAVEVCFYGLHPKKAILELSLVLSVAFSCSQHCYSSFTSLSWFLFPISSPWPAYPVLEYSVLRSVDNLFLIWSCLLNWCILN